MSEISLSLIDPIIGIEDASGQGMVIINVQGISDCETVSVLLHNPNSATTTPQKVVDVINGNWFAQFTSAAGYFEVGDFLCGATKVEVRVECKGDPDSKKTFIPVSVPCRPKEGDCPKATLTITPLDTCINGVREVAVKAQIEDSPDATYDWFLGVDQDLQPGEDSLAGAWLPAADPNGVRTIQTSFFYDAFDDQDPPIVVRLETSTGPGPACIYQKTFVLEHCECDVDVQLVVRNANDIVNTDVCVPLGQYNVHLTSPSNTAGTSQSWSLNGDDANNGDVIFPVDLAAGETADVSIAVSVGTCLGSSAVTINACPDCREYTVDLSVFDSESSERNLTSCLPAGTYKIVVTEPSGNGVTATWSIDGVQQSFGEAFEITIAEGDSITLTANVEHNGCEASNSVTLSACKDCDDFNAQLRVLNSDGDDVTGVNCLPDGDYTVELVSPDPTTSNVQWQVNNADRDVDGTTLDVTLQSEESFLVSVSTRQDECTDQAAVNIQSCPQSDPQFLPCILLKIFALIGFGVFFLGIFLALCPTMATPLITPDKALIVAAVLIVLGALLFALFFALWLFLCRPDRCSRSAFIWQAVVLLGLIMVYAGFCPTCSWMLLGVVVLLFGLFLFLRWRNECRPTPCTVVTEWIALFTFVVNIIAVMEAFLAACVIASNPILAILWGLSIAGVQAFLWWRANELGCIRR